jgi:thiol-disulfide isomerase/thioredoxin
VIAHSACIIHAMSRSLPLLLAFPLLFALPGCGQSSAQPGPDPGSTSAAKPGSSPSSSPTDGRGFVVTQIKPTAATFLADIQAEVKKAKGQGLAPYVEFWATWCEPCMAIKKGLSDPQMKAAFKGTYIIQIDADSAPSLDGTGFKAGVIPIFYEVGDDGKPTGRTIDGGAWGDNIPANMAPPLDRFFHKTS